MAEPVVVDTMIASAWLGVRRSQRQIRWAPVLEAAIAVVDCLGHRDLTVRLVQWVTRTFPGDVRPMFGPALVALGFSIAYPAASDLPLEDIDRLMDEVLAITDRT